MMMRLSVLVLGLSAASSFVLQQPDATRKQPLRRQHPQQLQPVSSSTRLFSSAAADLPEGLTKTVTQQGSGAPIQLGDIATIKYSCYLADAADMTTIAKANPSQGEKMVVGDGSMVDGWEKAIRTMRVGERSVIRVNDPELAYGSRGVPPLVPPNAILEMDVEIVDAQAPTANIDFDNLALDSTPTTAADIAKAFEARQAAKAGQVEKEGLEAFIDKIRTSYFYGLFEGETGQQAPWFLRPSITFPLAFLVVGAAFYVSWVSGAITERGAQTTDELDEIILSSNAILTTLATSYAFLP